MRLILIVLWFIAYASFAWGVLRFFTRTVRVGWHTGLVAPLGLASGLWHLTAVITTRATAWDQAAGACCVAGATLLFWSAVSACGALRPTAIFETDSPAHLLCSGPYRYIRHPFYASYTLFWIGGTVAAGRPSPSGPVGAARYGALRREALRPSSRFALYTAGFLVLFALASPLYLGSASVLAVAAFVARSAAGVLTTIGVRASSTDNVLWTARGGFMVTQECLVTPLIPVYLAGVTAWSTRRRHWVIGVLAAVPLFVALGIARLLVVALPAVLVDSPLVLIHAFFQLLLGAVIVVLVSLWCHERTTALGRAAAGLVLGVLFVQVLGPAYTRALTYLVGVPRLDPQQALTLLPSFQVGLYAALSVVAYPRLQWRRLLAGLAVLGLTHVLAFVSAQVLVQHMSWPAPVSAIRAWAVAGPLLILALLGLGRARTPR